MKKTIEKVKNWIVENPEKLAYGIAGVVTIGTGIVMYRLHLVDTKHCNSPRPIYKYDPLAIKDMGVIGERILSEQPTANLNDLVEYDLIYNVLKD